MLEVHNGLHVLVTVLFHVRGLVGHFKILAVSYNWYLYMKAKSRFRVADMSGHIVTNFMRLFWLSSWVLCSVFFWTLFFAKKSKKKWSLQHNYHFLLEMKLGWQKITESKHKLLEKQYIWNKKQDIWRYNDLLCPQKTVAGSCILFFLT